MLEDLRRDAISRDNLSEEGAAPCSHLAESIEMDIDSSYYELLSSSNNQEFAEQLNLSFTSPSRNNPKGILSVSDVY